jgi:hypothetical protein
MNKTAVKRYWMESEGPMGERVDSDESSVQVVLASDYAALKSREAVLVRLIRRYAAECVECNGTGRKFMYVSEITDDDVYDDCSQCADIRAALAQVPK